MPDLINQSEIKIPAHDGGAFSAYVALPNVTPAPAIIMIQEIFGVNQEMRDKCDEMARQGYIAIAPDLFWRIEPGIELSDNKPEEIERAFELYNNFDINAGIEDLKTTLGYLRNRKECMGQVGCVGYCLGGFLAFAMSIESNIDASVSYYGVNIPSLLEREDEIQTPLLMHIAEKDEFVPPEDQEQIKAVLANHPHANAHTYKGQNHAFARVNGAHYNEEAANLANQRTADFLTNTLKQTKAA